MESLCILLPFGVKNTSDTHLCIRKHSSISPSQEYAILILNITVLNYIQSASTDNYDRNLTGL